MRQSDSIRRVAVPLLVAIPAATAFVLLTRAVAAGTARAADRAVRREVRRFRSPAFDTASGIATALTAPALLVTLSLVLAFRVRSRGLRVWLPIASAPFLAMLAGRAFTEYLPQQEPPPSEDGECEPCFPSGHTTGLTAEAFTIAYALRGDGAIGPVRTSLLLLAPFAGGLNRLYRDRHWATDVAAGLSAGAVIASALEIVSALLRPDVPGGPISPKL